MAEFMPVTGYSLFVPMNRLNEEWAEKNHAQSLNKLAERGGLSLCEIAAIINKRPWREISQIEALSYLRLL